MRSSTSGGRKKVPKRANSNSSRGWTTMTAGWDTDTFCRNIQSMKSIETAGISDRQQPVGNASSPGVSLMDFLSTHQAEILNQEKDNLQFAHLYGFENYWVAFEHSAYQLCRLFPRSETSIIRFITYPFPVVMAAVTDAELRAYSRRHILRIAKPDYRMLTTEELPLERYREWHRVEVEELT